MTDKTIQLGSTITMHFTIKLTDNSIAQTTKDGEPSTFVMTEDSLKDPVESKLVGLKEGEKMRVELSPDEAYGFPNPDNFHVVPRVQFSSDTELQVGDVYRFDRPNGEAVPGVVSSLDGDNVTVNFNHPLSGQSLLFLAEIIVVS
jgi:FKBP-type peptidyl-prolyl cis-trans isomerase SlpA